MIDSKTNSQSNAAFQLKGSMFTLTMLQLLQSDSVAFAHQLDQLVTKNPNFFKNAPVVIDLEKFSNDGAVIDFWHIKSELIKHGLIPVGIRNATDPYAQAAIAAGLGILSASGKPEQSNKPQVTVDKNITSKVITQPVRSGQQVYAQQGDLIVLASVSPGAELMAEGNIHVYGTLRGRALAGVAGNTEARIFCRKLEAELISIAGYYKLHDDIKVPKAPQGVQVFYENEKLQIEAIG